MMISPTQFPTAISEKMRMLDIDYSMRLPKYEVQFVKFI